MRSGIKETMLAGALTFSGLGGLPSPAIAKTDSPQPIISRVDQSRNLTLETPALTFNQEAYVPNEGDAIQIQSIAGVFLEAGANPDFIKELTERFYDEFDTYFNIHKANSEFGFQYSPFGKENPVLVNFFAIDQPTSDPQFTETTNILQLTVGDDGTLLSPRIDVSTFPLDNLPEIIDGNFTGVKGVDGITWDIDTADPLLQTIATQNVSPLSLVVVTGDTQGNLFYGTRFIAPTSE